jgi:hypothetical protein
MQKYILARMKRIETKRKKCKEEEASAQMRAGKATSYTLPIIELVVSIFKIKLINLSKQMSYF